MNTFLNSSALRTRALMISTCTAASVLLVACGGTMSAREKGTAQGAAVGAAAGAVIGAVSGSNAGTGAALGGVAGAIAGNLWSKRMEDKRRAMEQATAGTGAEVTRTPDNQLKVNVPADVSFDTGSAALNPAMRPILDTLARDLDGSTRVRIIGHTDSTGSDALNETLSINRARTVRDYLEMRGVPASRLSAEGQGARMPIATNDTVAGRAQNRRVEILLSQTQAAS